MVKGMAWVYGDLEKRKRGLGGITVTQHSLTQVKQKITNPWIRLQW